MAELVDVSEGCEYQHNATKESKIEYTQLEKIQNLRYFLNRPRITSSTMSKCVHAYVWVGGLDKSWEISWPLYKRIQRNFATKLTVDQTWIHDLTPKSKLQSQQWIVMGELAPIRQN